MLGTPRESEGDLPRRRQTSQDLAVARLLPDGGPARAVAATATLHFSFLMEARRRRARLAEGLLQRARHLPRPAAQGPRWRQERGQGVRLVGAVAHLRFRGAGQGAPRRARPAGRGGAAEEGHAAAVDTVDAEQANARQGLGARERSSQLATYLSTVLAGAEAQAAAEPSRFNDVADVSSAIPSFFGLQDKSGSQSDTGGMTFRRAWSYPDGAEERATALVYPMCRGAYIWNHNFHAASSDSKISKIDNAETLGDIAATRGELRGAVLRGVQPPAANGVSSPASPWTSSQRQSLQRGYSPTSPGSSPEASRLPSPLPSPAVPPAGRGAARARAAARRTRSPAPARSTPTALCCGRWR
ncbi:unnamed protein product [Prorocentrum cordatum]|uniref:Uncharacterized protein n=1 Tax=Prorocentrum cordatum TaxID=2364126 RepID=A0ABN9S864_9DINO|nr:unnamed protein product [Polarella glacialis]